MNVAFSLKFNYTCSPLCKWVYFSPRPVCFSVLHPFILHLSCSPLCESMSWILNLWGDSSRRKKKKKQCHSKQPSHILYNKVVVSKEEKSQRGIYRGFDCPLHLILWFLVWMFPRTHTWFFVSVRRLTLAQRQRGQAVRRLSTLLGLVGCELPKPHEAEFLNNLYTMWLLINTFRAEPRWETWTVRRGQGRSTVHQTLLISELLFLSPHLCPPRSPPLQRLFCSDSVATRATAKSYAHSKTIETIELRFTDFIKRESNLHLCFS